MLPFSADTRSDPQSWGGSRSCLVLGGYLEALGPEHLRSAPRRDGACGQSPAIDFALTGILKHQKNNERFKYRIPFEAFRNESATVAEWEIALSRTSASQGSSLGFYFCSEWRRRAQFKTFRSLLFANGGLSNWGAPRLGFEGGQLLCQK